MPADPPRLVLFARYPKPGAAKTRLIPALGADGAAAVHRVLTERTVACLREASGEVEVRFTGADAGAFADWLGDVALVEQAEGGLSERLTAALDPAPVIFFGADTPDLTREIVEAAIAALATTHDGAIGPAEDGGYYLIALAAAYPSLFEGIDWSTERVFAQTMAKAEALGLRMAMLPTLADCDRPEDLARWPWLTA